MKQSHLRAYGYNEVSSGEESSFESSSRPEGLSKEREWQRWQQHREKANAINTKNNSNNPFNPFGIAVRHLNSSSSDDQDGDDEDDYELATNRLNTTTETGNTHNLSKYEYSREVLENSRNSSSTASTQKQSGKSFSHSNSSSFSFGTKKKKRDNTANDSSLNTTKTDGKPKIVTPEGPNTSRSFTTTKSNKKDKSYSNNSSSVNQSRSMLSSSMGTSLQSSLMSSLMPSMNLMSSSSSEDEEEETTDYDEQQSLRGSKYRNRGKNHHDDQGDSSLPPPSSKPRFLQELPKAKDEEPPPKYYHPAYWNARLSRREIYSRHYRPSKKELDEMQELENWLGLPDARKNRKNIIIYQWMQMNPSDAASDGLPRSIVLKRGPVAWSNHEECELILLTRGFVVARKVFQYIPRFQTSDVWTNVNKITPTGMTSFAICCGARKTLEFTCPTGADKDAWLQALKIVVLQAHTHSSFNPKNEREYDMGWQYRLIHTPWFTEAVTGVIRLDSHNLDQMDNRTINQLDTYNSYAPLHYAVRANNVDAMRFLLQAGADPNVADGFGRSPMFYGKIGCCCAYYVMLYYVLFDVSPKRTSQPCNIFQLRS
mgnify:CR=1 FL=1